MTDNNISPDFQLQQDFEMYELYHTLSARGIDKHNELFDKTTKENPSFLPDMVWITKQIFVHLPSRLKL